jgi:hypothetical protein
MAESTRGPAFDEQYSNSSLVNFENLDSLSDILLAETNNKINRFIDTRNGTGDASRRPSTQPSHDENTDDTDTSARLKTLQQRNQQLQRALALASVQYSKELASMKRKIEKLEQHVAELEAGGQKNN